jgi:CDGSH-type Zn-finger protein
MSEGSRIRVLDDGPLLAESIENLDNSKGEKLEVNPRFTLCRCGASAKKPYCDGSHKKIGFSSRLDDNNSVEELWNGGVKGIKVLRNGPYEVRGCMESDDRDIMSPYRKETYYLCRCGASNNKPFCDGSHKVIKFVDDKN